MFDGVKIKDTSRDDNGVDRNNKYSINNRDNDNGNHDRIQDRRNGNGNGYRNRNDYGFDRKDRLGTNTIGTAMNMIPTVGIS